MTYLNGYQHDIFVSYGHTPDENLSREQFGDTWTNCFCKQLTAALNRRLIPAGNATSAKEGVDVWHDSNPDDEFRKNVDTTSQLNDRLEDSAILIALVNKKYDASHYCKLEAEWFKSKTVYRRRSYSRIFVVAVGESKTDNWPEALFDAQKNPLEMYSNLKGQGDLPIGWPLPETGADGELSKYTKGINHIANQIEIEIRNISKEEAPRKSNFNIENVRSSTHRVFLGYTSQPLTSDREQAKILLEDRGYDVFAPEWGEFYKTSTLLNDWLGQCQTFVQLLDDTADEYISFQIEEAKRQNLKIAAFWKSNLEPDCILDSDFKELVLALDSRKHLTLDEFIEGLDSNIEDLQPFPIGPRIFVCADKCDLHWAKSFREQALKYGVFPALPNEFEAGEDKEWKELILSSQGFILAHLETKPSFIPNMLYRLNSLYLEVINSGEGNNIKMPYVCIADVTPPGKPLSDPKIDNIPFYSIDVNNPPKPLDKWLTEVRLHWKNGLNHGRSD